MLYTMKPLLEAAREGHYSVAAPNVLDSGSIAYAIKAAEELNAPVILDISHNNFDTAQFRLLASIAADAGSAAKVPVAVNLDHGGKYEHCMDAVVSKCTSLMVDRSSLPFEENLTQVAEFARMAHAVGMSIEAELGHVGMNVGASEEGPSTMVMETADSRKAAFTKVEEAIEYVDRTGVDCLAVAIGTCHGLYPKGVKPELDFELLHALREALPVPLVIHGGSGTGDEVLSRACREGICKVNLFSDLMAAAAERVKGFETNNPYKFLEEYFTGYKEKIQHYIKVLGSEGKAW